MPEHMPPASSSPLPPPSSLTRLGRLCASLGAIWLFMHIVAPKLIELIPPLRDHARIVDQTGIAPGALFYTDLPQSIDGEFNNRDAIRYFVVKEKN